LSGDQRVEKIDEVKNLKGVTLLSKEKGCARGGRNPGTPGEQSFAKACRKRVRGGSFSILFATSNHEQETSEGEKPKGATGVGVD
jgi:hypothetical protein